MNVATILGVIAGAYLLGSFPAGYLVGRLWGIDVLSYGSGRTGGTNVLRSAGPIAALLTGAIDVGKGALAVWLAGQITGQPAAEVLAGVAVILGHNHSIFLHFRGGAGVGTSLGALGAIYLPAGIALLVLLLVVVAVTRYASVGSLVVITVMPLLLLALALNGILSMTYLAYGVLAWAIILNSHRPNIRRLLLGTERRLGNHEPPPR